MRDVLQRLRDSAEIAQLRSTHGECFDDHVGNEILNRGRQYCDSEQLAMLYCYRYAPMHHAALTRCLPEGETDVLIDFGGGPGTAMLAVAGRQAKAFRRLSLEHAEGMQRVAKLAQSATNGRCAESVESKFPDAQFWLRAQRAATGRRVVLAFSYFFAQDLSSGFVAALAGRVGELSALSKTIVYTNPVGPAASWMPDGGVHDWYRHFCRTLGHRAAIRRESYSYLAIRNLSDKVRRSGECAAEVWVCR